METTQMHKKKWYKKKKIIIPLAIIIVLVIVGFIQMQRGDTGPQYETTTVQRGSLIQTVDATGNVASSDEIDLRFETSGRVSAVYKKTNDVAKKGDVIASLDVRELNARVAQASAGVDRAQSNLDKVLAGETSAYISNLKAKLDQSEANMSQTIVVGQDTIANAEAVLDKAEYNLKLSEGGQDSEIVQDSYEDMVALLQSIQNSLADALTESDNILGIDNTLANDDFDDVLSVLSSSALSQAKTEYYAVRGAKKDVDKIVNPISIHSSHEDIDIAADTAEEGLLAMKNLLFSVANVLDNTIPIGDLTQAELTTLKSNINTQRASVNTDYTSLINQQQAIRTAKNSYSTYLVAYNQAKQNLENAKAKASADVSVQEALFNQAQASYDDAVSPPLVADIANAEAQIREARANLAQTAATREKARIIAPVNGVLGRVDMKVGEYVSVSDSVAQLVSPHFEITVDIPETDIVKISQGDSADITLDAFGDDVHFEGQVTEIEIGETVIQDVIYYKVTVSMNGDADDYDILNGMTANVVFYTQQKDDVLHVPQRVVLTDNEWKYVRVLKADGSVENIYVETGLRADDGLIEIVSGLEEGQEVIVREIE